MAGGIFPNSQFSLNLKCIIFTLFIALGYWYLPYRNYKILLFLLWIPYLGLAWYDYAYDCKNRMVPTLFPFGRYIYLPFKPKDYQDEFKKLNKEQIKAMDSVDHITLWTLIIIFIYYLYS